MPLNSTVTKTRKGNDHEHERDAEEMQMRIGIGIAVVVAIGLIWSVAVMSEWVPVVSADAALGTRISATPPAVSVWVGPSGDGIMH
jgi:adenosine/AMP kinase